MTLYDLSTQILIQGNICVKVFDEEGNEKDARFYHDESDFDTNTSDCNDIEESEVTYIYPTKSIDGTPWLVIEVSESHEV